MKYNISGTDPAQFKELLSTLSPANDILHTIQFDHLYTSSSQSSGNGSTPGAVNHTVRLSNVVPQNQTFGAARKSNQNVLQYLGDTRNEADINSLNAESIQRVFQNMLNMTALTDIADLAEPNNSQTRMDSKISTSNTCVSNTSSSTNSKIHTIKLVNRIPIASSDKELDMSHLKASTKLQNKSEKVNDIKKSNPPSTSEEKRVKRHESIEKQPIEEDSDNALSTTKVDEREWKTVTRCIQAEQEMNTLLKFTAELLVKRWGEYLSMSMEEISDFEVKSARELGLVEEAVEMLEDKNRYVWQLIEQLQF